MTKERFTIPAEEAEVYVVPLSHVLEANKSLEKAGPFIGPRGGKWADPKHTIPWKEAKVRKPAEPKMEETPTRFWVDHAPGMPKRTVDEHRIRVEKDPKTSDKIGVYKKSRKAVHDGIINDFLKGKKAPPADTQKVAVVMMGGPASGKTTLVKTVLGEKFSDFVNVNPDDVKEQLPEYNKGLNLGSKEGKPISAKDTALMVHDESSDVAGEVHRRAVKQGLNLVIDGTGKDAPKHIARINKLKEQGYHVMLLMPTIPTDMAVGRSRDRAARSGRYVPDGPPPPGSPDIIRPAHSAVTKNFEKVARSADEFSLWDSDQPMGKPPIRKWSGGTGVGDTIIDQRFVDEFKKRGKGGEVEKSMSKAEPKPKKGKKKPHYTMDELAQVIESGKPPKEEVKGKFDKHTGVEVRESMLDADLGGVEYE